MHNLKIKIAVLLSCLIVMLSFAPALVLAVDDCDTNKDNAVSNQEAILCGSNQASGSKQTVADANTSLDNTIKSVVNVISVIVGLLAVVMIITAGLRFITSSGEAEKIKNAKNTIIYALVGLVVVALAQVIVQFVLDKATAVPSKTAPPAANAKDGAKP
jgi:beta-lactamase regulating signal transducer with metallopeptidase domain